MLFFIGSCLRLTIFYSARNLIKGLLTSSWREPAMPLSQFIEYFKSEVARMEKLDLTSVQRDDALFRLREMAVRVDGVVKDVKQPVRFGPSARVEVVIDMPGIGEVLCEIRDQSLYARAQNLKKGQKVDLIGEVVGSSIKTMPYLTNARFF